ncbi:GspH/FimT family pseudopilin [Cellvibrio sp.]|uniref:GspH/FimT family pseudopilin n=1 Tax=Cellvibrio sp. TaxID=1965322 RepID=UPI0039647A13
MHQQGFSLLDLITSTCIISILFFAGLPGLFHQVQNNKTKTFSQSLMGAIEFTRERAVSANKRTTLRRQIRWEDGWEIFFDTNENGIKDSTEEALVVQPASDGIKIKTNNPVDEYISFIGTGESRKADSHPGGAFLAGSISICAISPGKGYKLILARGGRLRMTELSSAECATI